MDEAMPGTENRKKAHLKLCLIAPFRFGAIKMFYSEKYSLLQGQATYPVIPPLNLAIICRELSLCNWLPDSIQKGLA